jgi:hypothetical protein
VEIDPDLSTAVASYLAQRDDVSDQVDGVMVEKINFALAPYTDHPSVFSKTDYLLGRYAKQSVIENRSYPSEANPTNIRWPDVRELRNAAVVFENDYPVMFFYLTSRHKYREIVANFSHDRAYFAGVRQVAFSRERYTVASDNAQYNEPAGDLLNTERNDFVTVDGAMVIE